VRRFTGAYADYALLENFALPWGSMRPGSRGGQVLRG
jgi:hypothetical protein